MAIQEIKNKIDAAEMPEVTKYGGQQVSSQPKGPPILEDNVVGFEKVGNEIAEKLVRGKKQLQIISIFGMPGLVRKLISLWIAEGHVKKEEHERIEDVALKYLMELIDRSLGSCECVVGIERLVHLRSGTYFSESCRQQATKDDRFQINSNLQNVSALTIHDETDEKILRCLHNLRRLTI
ncbi:Hypothetical predicted protein [Olea europaea subsp. europaea]|uniref:Disease resistance protein winged helix domain-containing protein n=1 Tax=Olea europaea subsp. europaea TaxID=158383 RepID=A0A8S0RAG0_OLEEU|nr:Hypothetical predicted protein [Olea europaea subsp. europaea]